MHQRHLLPTGVAALQGCQDSSSVTCECLKGTQSSCDSERTALNMHAPATAAAPCSHVLAMYYYLSTTVVLVLLLSSALAWPAPAEFGASDAEACSTDREATLHYVKGSLLLCSSGTHLAPDVHNARARCKLLLAQQ